MFMVVCTCAPIPGRHVGRLRVSDHCDNVQDLLFARDANVFASCAGTVINECGMMRCGNGKKSSNRNNQQPF